MHTAVEAPSERRPKLRQKSEKDVASQNVIASERDARHDSGQSAGPPRERVAAYGPADHRHHRPTGGDHHIDGAGCRAAVSADDRGRRVAHPIESDDLASFEAAGFSESL